MRNISIFSRILDSRVLWDLRICSCHHRSPYSSRDLLDLTLVNSQSQSGWPLILFLLRVLAFFFSLRPRSKERHTFLSEPSFRSKLDDDGRTHIPLSTFSLSLLPHTSSSPLYFPIHLHFGKLTFFFHLHSFFHKPSTPLQVSKNEVSSSTITCPLIFDFSGLCRSHSILKSNW